MAVSDQAVLTGKQLDLFSINTIRTLSIDAVQKANSGHPGAPMALAPVAYVLWQEFQRYDPADPVWPNRDRFILSNGHASMLLYSMLYLSGVRAVDSEYKVIAVPRAAARAAPGTSAACFQFMSTSAGSKMCTSKLGSALNFLRARATASASPAR